MEIDSDSDQSTKQKAQSLHTLSSSPLPSSLSKLSASSKPIPSGEDFHFYYNFPEFKAPIKQITNKTDSALQSIASKTSIVGKNPNFPEELDEVYDWLVNVNDEVFERVDGCIDEFRRVRKLEEESGKSVSAIAMLEDDGFQLVCGRKKRGGRRDDGCEKNEKNEYSSSVKTVTKNAWTTGGKPRVPFHVPSITKPQLQFRIAVDNSNEAFRHLWLERSEDGSRAIHPLEKFSEVEFLDKHVREDELVKPLDLDITPFKLVEEVKDLKELAAKLRDVNEFAVDLEHNQYRSFQGLTCLMQISTRFEDFVVDTLKLHAHIGPHLRDVFKDPSKKKVMHGADRDIVWLQRDFGIYICNMFDTGQASRVLKLERNSLEYLLQHFCGVTANKEYQNADWRVRPIPDEMLKYAREDTHYLLHIYDLMRVRLLEASKDLENVDALLLEVYKRSYDVCMQLYEKDIFTDTSYLYIYGLQALDFNSEQLAVVAGLCEWRDGVARAEDESTGFILPNKALLEIARQMPLTAGKLRRLGRSNHPYVDRNIGAVVAVIKRSIENASAFESVAEQLQKAREEMASVQNTVVADESENLLNAVDPIEMDTVTAQESIKMECLNETSVESAECTMNSMHVMDEPAGNANSTVECGSDGQKRHVDLSGQAGELKKELNNHQVELPQEKFVHTGQMGAINMKVSNEATVQVLKKPSRAFGALLGYSSSKRKLSSDPKVDVKVEQIQAMVTLPFHSFWGKSDKSEPPPKENTSQSDLHPSVKVSEAAATSSLEDVILFENGSNDQEAEDVAAENGDKNDVNEMELDTEDMPVALSELKNPKRNNKSVEKPQESEPVLQLKPFDYAAAREQVNFGGRREKKKTVEEEEDGNKNLQHSKEKRKNSANSRVPRVEGTSEFAPARRRMAFPPTGNRSATFR